MCSTGLAANAADLFNYMAQPAGFDRNFYKKVRVDARKTLFHTGAMKKLFTLVLLVLVTVACTKEAASVRKTDAQEAAGAQANRFAVLIDVREASERAEHGVIPGAYWIADSKVQAGGSEWQEFKEKMLAENKSKELIFFCAKGGRAGKAAELMAKEGFKTANMGGFGEWKAAGLPTEKTP